MKKQEAQIIEPPWPTHRLVSESRLEPNLEEGKEDWGKVSI